MCASRLKSDLDAPIVGPIATDIDNLFYSTSIEIGKASALKTA
jgi:hypothetical protein